MKKHKVIMAIVCLSIILSMAIVLTGCSDNIKFKNFVKFKETDVEKIEIISEYNVVKEVAIDKVFACFNKVTFIKIEEEKYDSDWDINRKMTVNFYLKGKEGHYSLIINNGARAMNGYNGKGTTGFYQIDAEDTLLIELNELFYAK